jgi:DNA-binding NarL/FixJ family response regulator
MVSAGIVVTLMYTGSEVCLTVTDDGPCGDAWAPGVGLRSIAERAAELGGHATAGPAPHGGRVVAVLPLAVTAAPPVERTSFPDLTPRERQVLDQVAAGLSNAVIAARLGLSVKTVGNHTSSIFAKLRVADRAEAIVRAREAGLGRHP